MWDVNRRQRITAIKSYRRTCSCTRNPSKCPRVLVNLYSTVHTGRYFMITRTLFARRLSLSLCRFTDHPGAIHLAFDAILFTRAVDHACISICCEAGKTADSRQNSQMSSKKKNVSRIFRFSFLKSSFTSTARIHKRKGCKYSSDEATSNNVYLELMLARIIFPTTSFIWCADL